MSGSWVVDTSVMVAVLNEDPVVMAHWDSARQLLLAAPVYAELLFGARNSRQAAENEARLRHHLRQTRFVTIGARVIDCYVDLRLLLHRAGQPIPSNDLWIAATCLAVNAPLASRDAHFDHVPGLVRDEWR